MAFIKPLNLLYFDLNAAHDVQQPGEVMSLEAAGTILPCTGANPPIIGVAYMTTEDPLYDPNVTGHTTQYLLGVEVGIVREGVVRVPYDTNTSAHAIAIGNLVAMTGRAGATATAGYVDYYRPTAFAANAAVMEENRYIVGIALSTADANAKTGDAGKAAYVKVLLTLRDVEFEA